ncbi:carboxymuconolactone decarboxylase family protein [Neobacillus sp. PS3-40]|uniref:carboxymuconolactone decarboxylase family protein n=1 Tax=Neobacillus sp. PS3-40 TaxID=3070679 RepID=UPI0027E077AA|nr:carboxymuconolactone decarboxylase family protein [Neobacillus sp. PS3-40]WML42727.1 carboxymuconolactone decarboxylase family protein [Neobacillus sp. PS3-40]
MKKEIDYYNITPEGLKIMVDMEKHINNVALPSSLKELIKIRVSQINGCAFCLNMHSSDAKKSGETDQRINCLSAWGDCEFYSDEEKAALLLAEHITLISEKRVPTSVYEEVSKYFTDEEYVNLVLCINQINSWNRISISMGKSAK